MNANPDYFDYKFEGFQIFQLANSDVSISDIYDPTQSRMVAQCDIKNDLTQLINWEVDPDMNALVPQDMTLQSNNSGILRHLKLMKINSQQGIVPLLIIKNITLR